MSQSPARDYEWPLAIRVHSAIETEEGGGKREEGGGRREEGRGRREEGGGRREEGGGRREEGGGRREERGGRKEEGRQEEGGEGGSWQKQCETRQCKATAPDHETALFSHSNNELSQMGLKLTKHCILCRCSTNCMYHSTVTTCTCTCTYT